MKVNHLLELLEELGFEFELDFDDELLWTVPESITGKEVHAAIFRLGMEDHALKRPFMFRAAQARSVFCGGPLNGSSTTRYEPKSRSFLSGGRYFYVEFYLIHRGRADWLVYRAQRKGGEYRGFFIGTASSKKKAIDLAMDDGVRRNAKTG